MPSPLCGGFQRGSAKCDECHTKKGDLGLTLTLIYGII